MPSLTSSASSAPTAAQLNYVRNLRSERTAEQFQSALSQASIPAGYADALSLVSRRQISLLIDSLAAMPRSTTPALDATRGEVIPVPTQHNRAGRMLAAGSLEATVVLMDGRHVTVTVRTRTRSGRGWTNAALGEGRTKVSILGNAAAKVTGTADAPRITYYTRREEYRKAIEAVFSYAAGDMLPVGVQSVREASRCGRCFRTLTDPVSIDRGIGPECYGRSTGSRHVGSRTDTVTYTEEQPLSPVGPTFRIDVNTGRPVIDEPVVNMVTSTYTIPTPDVEVASPAPAAINIDVTPAELDRAQSLIAEALDAYLDGSTDATFALNVFKAMADQVQR